MFFRDTIDVYRETQINTLRGKNAEFMTYKPPGSWRN
jgi:hypothetical protein